MKFDSSRDIHTKLYEAAKTFLNESQRSAVEEILIRHLSGGVSAGEVSGSVTRELRKLRDDHGISHFEYEKVMEFLLRE